MRTEFDVKLDFKDVLIKPKRSTLRSRKEVELVRQPPFKFKYSEWEWGGVPIVASNMDTVGTFEMARVFSRYKMLTCIHKYYTLEQWQDEILKLNFDFVAPSIGANDEDFVKFTELCKIADLSDREIKILCIDVANGYGEYFPEFIKRVRETWPKLTIIAGNVVTDEMTEQLILSGADIVKVGLGSGSVCTTRLQTGVGYPQLSAVMECADAAHGLGGQIISDGGCTCPGDVAKAFGGGADFVMLGGMLAGHDESGGELISEWHKSSLVIHDIDGTSLGCLEVEKKFKKFYGMSSETAMNKYHGGVAKYRASEGKEVTVEYRGPVQATIQQIFGGLKSTCTYVGAPSLKQLSKCTTFIRVTQQVNGVYSE
jgi:GMP reductase